MTTPHESSTCTRGPDGQPCDICRWANESKRGRCCDHRDEADEQASAHALVEDVVATVTGKLNDDDNSACNCPLHRLSLAERTARIDAAIDATNTEIVAGRLANFGYVWSTAPRLMRNYVEREVAEFWYLTGQRDGYGLATKTHNGDLRETVRVKYETFGFNPPK